MSYHPYMKQTILFLFTVAVLARITTAAESPESLIEKAVQAMGGKDAFYAKGSVEYEYTYRKEELGKEDISTERYVFDGEKSWAHYTKRELLFPEVEGSMIQGYNGSQSWVTLDGQLSSQEDLLKRTDFMRKTNYYWFAMMFKLQDSGGVLTMEEPQEINGINYHRVRLTFEDGVGDVKDIYVLYIHPETYLIDQFLFTILDFGLTDPFLMEVEYTEHEGIQLSTTRRYIPSNWDAEIKGEHWVYEISKKIQFGKELPASLFEKP
ncbi:MAG: DUF6503 family protein [Verrucomicrobiota bacterium]